MKPDCLVEEGRSCFERTSTIIFEHTDTRSIIRHVSISKQHLFMFSHSKVGCLTCNNSDVSSTIVSVR